VTYPVSALAQAPVPQPPAAVLNDPHGLGMSVGRLGHGTRKAARAALVAAGVLLGEGESVECLVGGRYRDADAVAVLTNRRLLVVNDRPWKADVVEFTVDGSLTVQGWQDDRAAALLIQRLESSVQLERIGDRTLAMELAQRLRARATG
jgi:hypothetical protein